MSQDYRIKEYRFPSVTFNATTTQAYYTDHAINGEILEVEWKSSITGSVWLVESGTNMEVWRNNAISGAAWQDAYPRVFGQLSTGSVTSATMISRPVNEPLALNVGSALSGTTMSITGFVIKYR